ncbi:hypothetical protein V1512DRAFT_256206 [Lipomyces arxii]|uniref:uncharacterized protein n=1 Tax=Lipomyces arxii TaxID=56418 RepID=UPI0034CFBDCD
MARPPAVATRSWTFTNPASHPHWTYETIALPIPKHLVLVQVSAATISACDVAILQTQLLWTTPTEKGLGREFAGKILHVGANQAKNWSEGEEVCGLFYHVYGPGTVASHVLIDPTKDFIVRRPEFLPAFEAAAFPLSFSLALQCLKNVKLTPSSTVCVLGGGTNVGLFAIQLAKKYFMVQRVVATCSRDSDDTVRYMGADDTIYHNDYDKRQLVQAVIDAATPTGPGTYDLVVDTVGVNPVIMERLKDLTPAKTGWFVTTVGDVSSVEGASFLVSSSPRKSLIGAIRGPRYKVEYVASNLEHLKLALQLYEDCRLKILVDSVISWRKVEDVYKKVSEGKTLGKVVIEVEPF